MNYDINEYIEKAKGMPNTSDGGSAAYHFDDVVLVKYETLTKYGVAREKEEMIAEEANKKRNKGVRTPAHLAIKRVEKGENNICWVLQERAPGVSFANYSSRNNETKVQLERQSRLLQAPDSHYEQCVRDICELFHMGLELKDKNIYYDEDREKGGFTFIDLLFPDARPLDSNSITDVYGLCRNLFGISNMTVISSYHRQATQEEKDKSKEMTWTMKGRMFQAVEKVLPNFEQHRRWILRGCEQGELECFARHGIIVGDLNLTDEEYQQFDAMVEWIVDDSIERITSGANKFWQIGANEIRIRLQETCMNDAWKYHRENDLLPIDYEDDYEYDSAVKKKLEALVNEKFEQKLEEQAKLSNNSNILQAANDLAAQREMYRKRGW